MPERITMPFPFKKNCCCGGPTVAVCWSKNWVYPRMSGSSKDVLDYHITEINDLTGEINYSRTIPKWVYANNVNAPGFYFAPSYDPSSWVLSSAGATVQEKIDKWAGAGSVSVDPSGKWCVFTNRYRLVVDETSIVEIWDGNSGNNQAAWLPPTFRPSRGIGLQPDSYNRPRTVAGRMGGSIGGFVFNGDATPFSLWAQVPGYIFPPNWQGVFTGMADGRFCAFVLDYAPFGSGNVVPALWRYSTGEYGSIEKTFMYAPFAVSSGHIDIYGYRSYPISVMAPASGGILAYQRNDGAYPISYGHYDREFTFYNTSAIWNEPVNFLKTDNTFDHYGINNGEPLGPMPNGFGIGIWGSTNGTNQQRPQEIDSLIGVQTCDVQKEKKLYAVSAPPSLAYGGFRMQDMTFSQHGNAVIGMWRIPANGKFFVGRYDLDDLEWKWATEVPTEGGSPSWGWQIAARA